MNLSKILNELGEKRHEYLNAVSPPIFQTSNFSFDSVNKLRKSLKKEFENHFYTRGLNPTVEILRKKMAALEKCEDSIIFSSGCAAITAAILSQIKSNDHIICVQKPYSWTNFLLSEYLKKFNIKTTFINGKNPNNFKKAIKKNTKIIYLESPNSISFEIQDLNKISEIAKQNNIITICDNSYCSPLYQNPKLHGIDIIIHSASKYISGHSDVVAGVLCANKKIIDNIFSKEFMTFGGIISPHDAWLILRGLRTLKLRVDQSNKSANDIIKVLENHPKIEKIIYPMHSKNKQIELAKKQMKKAGGLFSIILKTQNINKIEKFCNSLNHFLIACSWGGHESLIFPICALYESQNYKHKMPINLIRIYIGLEDSNLLMRDIEQALKKI